MPSSERRPLQRPAARADAAGQLGGGFHLSVCSRGRGLSLNCVGAWPQGSGFSSSGERVLFTRELVAGVSFLSGASRAAQLGRHACDGIKRWSVCSRGKPSPSSLFPTLRSRQRIFFCIPCLPNLSEGQGWLSNHGFSAQTTRLHGAHGAWWGPGAWRGGLVTLWLHGTLPSRTRWGCHSGSVRETRAPGVALSLEKGSLKGFLSPKLNGYSDDNVVPAPETCPCWRSSERSL